MVIGLARPHDGQATEVRAATTMERSTLGDRGAHLVKRRVIAFDLDGTLAVSKSPISDVMANRLRDLLTVYEVCVISGGQFDQFKMQLIDRLDVQPEHMARLHIMPTTGTKYFRFDVDSRGWVLQYSEDLPPQKRAEIIDVLTTGAKHLGYWEAKPYGDIIEDRGSQITFSALGQQAPAEAKYAWDPDGVKKQTLRDHTARRLPDLEVHVGGTTSVDVTQAGIDKAYGMRKLMAVLDLASDDILFFGDKLEEGGNDYPVRAIGIDSIAVKSWEETALALEAIVAVS
jgi:HAD superfamily hydrolase (TIGR01484 family)